MKTKLIPKHLNSGKILTVQGKPVKTVSNNYLSTFPNLLYLYTNPTYNYHELELIKSGDIEKAEQNRTKRGKHTLNNLYNLQDNFTTNDSVFYTPILQRLDGLIGKLYDPNNYDKKTKLLERELIRNINLYANYFPAKEFNKDYEFIHNLLNKLTDDEIINIINTDFSKLLSIKDFMKVLPKNISIMNAAKAYNILSNMEDIEYKRDVKKAVSESKKSTKS